ncbi:MAG: hypothetical protein WC349_01800 [Patescibacteria group bacterium]|jgi:hypothetical protein
MRDLFIKFIEKSLIAFVFLLAIFLLPHFIVAADVSPDAIAVRIMPNPEHLSPLRWYQANIKTQGSPQSLQVDGYEAVRDGRTVYVNAANISGNNFYTNIYIISYNQEAENATVDVFGQILSHWKFNSNLSDASGKEKIVRDAKKLADLSEVKTLLEIYKTKFNSYPKLASGSYIAGKSVSTWPSWQATLAKSLGAALPIDPVNKMGVCAGYNTTTCWNENSKKFADPNPSDNNFELPTGSSAYVYTTNNNGASYDVCAVMESGYITTLEQGACYGSAGVKVGGSSLNNPPVIVCGTLEGSPNKEFIGYVKAYDSDAVDTIKSWAITSQSTAGWSPLQLRSSKVNNQKEIYSSKAGALGNYSFVLEVSDSRGLKVSTICPVTIKAVCGENGKELGEFCDDGTYNGQARHCNSTCTGWTPAECGNNVQEDGQYGNEICDDGSDNGTPNNCNITCDGTTPSYCGNGIKEAGEDCDKKDGTATSTADSVGGVKQYDCNSRYQANPCDFTGGWCGDGVKNGPAGWEVCDDGSALNGTPNHCDKICLGITPPVCGNDIIEAGEICEPSTYISPSPQNSSVTHQYGCSGANCSNVGGCCKPNIDGYCGDGVKNGLGEECDWKNYSVPTPAQSSLTWQYGCSSICKFQDGFCGDGSCTQKDGCSACAVDCKPVGATAIGFNALGECKATACDEAANYYLYNGGCVNCSALAARSGVATVGVNASGQCKIIACKNDYHLSTDGSACIYNMQTVACTDRPANADWNTSSTVLQTWDGSAWQPSNVSSHSTTAGICKFQCRPTYGWSGSACIACPTQTKVYAAATAGTIFTVPTGVTSIQVKAWGAGGGAGGPDEDAMSGNGGGGGYAMKTISVTPGQVLKVMVGGGGRAGGSVRGPGSLTAGGINGGGNGGRANVESSGGSGAGGGGGGFSGVYSGSTPLIIAGGGGGGGGAGKRIDAGVGGASGENGGGGGGGIAGASSSTTGGDGKSSLDDGGGGGGGGGGYFGGTGGADGEDKYVSSAGGGGGNNLGDTVTNGSGKYTANSGDADYNGSAGVGGTGVAGYYNGHSTPGASGLVVLKYVGSCAP